MSYRSYWTRHILEVRIQQHALWLCCLLVPSLWNMDIMHIACVLLACFPASAAKLLGRAQ